MKIYSVNNLGEEILAVDANDGLVNLTRAFQLQTSLNGCSIGAVSSLGALLNLTASPTSMIAEALEFIEKHNLGEQTRVSRRARILPPLRRPAKVIGLAYNYRKEGGPARDPSWFLKAPSAVIGPNEKIVIPEISEKTVFEAEVGAVIGRFGRKVRERDTLDLIFGYTIVNDVTAADILQKDLETSNSWMRAKGFDTFLPMGPCVLTADEVPDPGALEIVSRLNGKECQRGGVSGLVLGIAEIVEQVSRWITLEPGDVIATGTPPGSIAMSSGDTVECEVPRIGVLSNPVVGEKWFTRGDLSTHSD